MSGIRQSNCGDANTDSLLGAVRFSDLAEVKRLVIDCGIEPNVRGVDGATLLHYAAEYGSPKIVEFLLERGADPNVQYNSGWTPLHYAAKNCRVGVVRVLLDHGADLTIRDNKGKTPLDYGSDCGEFIEELRRRSTGTMVYE